MSKTIAAVATGNAVGGIGVIRISGDRAIEIANKVFSSKDGEMLTSLKGYHAKFGTVCKNGVAFDEAVALVFRSPKSYTGEDVVEISVHGGIFVVEKTLECLFDEGAYPAEAGEFTKRAFLNGKIDLTQAESIASIISACGEDSAKSAYNALSGALYKKISSVLEKLTDSSALMAAWVDYPDEEIPELSEENLQKTLETVSDELKELIDNYESGSIVQNGVDTVIVGRPNVGKSSLMNLLSGKEKSIVTEIRGTTRDIVENTVLLGSIALHLSDTAGIHESSDRVESIGIKRAYEKIEKAQLVLAVFDSSEKLSKDDLTLIELCKNKKAIAVINKQDLTSVADTKKIISAFSKAVLISAADGTGKDSLEKAVKEVLGVQNFDASSPILANKRQKQCCKNAYDNVLQALDAVKTGVTFDAINVMIDCAVDELLSLTGKKATEEVVNNIFSKFCVGK